MLIKKKFGASRLEGCLVFGALLLSLCEPAAAHSGDLNKHFGADGTMQWPLSLRIPPTQPVAVDRLNRAIYGTGTPSGDVIGALNADGSVDTTFGSGGTVTLDEYIADLAIDSHDRIVVAESSGSPFSKTVEICRYRPDGSLDPSFGTGGHVVLSSSAYTYEAAAVALDGNDNVYVAGTAFRVPSGTGTMMFAAKIDNGGVVDSTFGAGGTVVVNSGGSALNTSGASAVFVAPTGDVFVGGFSTVSGSFGLSTIVKLEADGSLDSSFGGTGVVQFDAKPSDPSRHFNATWSVTVDKAGDVLAAGDVGDLSTYATPTVTRMRPDGSMDSTFNGGAPELLVHGAGSLGKVVTAMIDGRDRIVLTGLTTDSTGTSHLEAFRLNVDGSLDSTFAGGAGYVLLSDAVAMNSGRGAFSHVGDILIFGSTDDLTAITATELVGYDIPPILPPGGFFKRRAPATFPSSPRVARFP